ncbi:bacteriochlorophyll/chlorophyll synthetase [Erythrobacter sp. QSSC1-22B]|uniref:chlorophyll synthase ChlG n=1 Tax=Erythrobacter sp. QSSC1-22B TaxID=1860125 RepID=UPI000804DC52|nr:chlorophyll synthase ChlG [Erythrobacter sp. QSSC1-22B]OBX20596.1 bacteriochlorophyll/chlorophyll synthetase [Erythrobacter sp. QSSC1-22B]
MERSAATTPRAAFPAPRDIVELLKPITWFPPMWAFLCGLVSSGLPLDGRWLFLIAGVALTGPLVCGTSQAVNDWYDRHVDAINEPDRPIPSGRIAGNWGLRIAIVGTLLSLLVAWAVGPWVLAATTLGLICAWIYSAPPLRLKTSGWTGPAVVALTYEGLTWFTGAAVMAGALPRGEILLILVLYSVGAHGIMTLNDFKAVEGDTRTGIRSLPVTLGMVPAARFACATMALAQVAVIALLAIWQMTVSAVAVCALLVAQLALMPRLVADPASRAPWYAARGVTLYVLGMLAAALGLGGHLG